MMTKTKEKLSTGLIYYKFVPQNMSPIGVVLCLTGVGQRTLTNYAALDGIEPSKQFDNNLDVPFIVIVAAGNPNSNPVLWMKNDYNPFVDLCKTFKLPMHVNGLSLGAMCLPELVSCHPGEFSSCASVAGLVNTFSWPSGAPTEQDIALPEFKKIPTKFYYGTADKVINGGDGYKHMLAFSQMLQQAGADNQWQPYSNRGHDIWPEAYADYWTWLLSKVVVPPVVTPTPDPTPTTNDPVTASYYDGKQLVVKLQSGKVINVAIIPSL